MIPYGRQSISEADIEAVIKVLRSDFLTQGPEVHKFETAVCNYTKSSFAIAVNSGSSALHLACLALNLTEGDILWTTPVSFVASANCALYCGAKVDFVDIDPHTFNMCTIALEEKLKVAEKSGRLPKIVVPVHLCGTSCDMQKINFLAKQYGFHIIEDACHAIGGQYKDKQVGSCEFSDITVFSFHPVKIITTAEGGMAVTNDEQLAEKIKLLRSHGITRDEKLMTHHPDGPWYYQQIVLGYNYRMSDVHAALGRSQLTRVDYFVSRRHQIAKRYNEMLANLPLHLQFHPADCYSSLHLYTVRIQKDVVKKELQQIFQELRESEIGVNLHYIPIHTQPYYQTLGFKNGDYPEAEQYYKEALTLPIYPLLTFEEQDKVVFELEKVLS